MGDAPVPVGNGVLMREDTLRGVNTTDAIGLLYDLFTV